MIQFEAKDNNERATVFSFEESLSEVTLKRFIDYKEKVELKKPKSLTEYESANQEEKLLILSEINIGEITGAWNDYTIEFVKFWAKMPDDIISNLPFEDVAYVYAIINNYFSNLNIDENKTGFEFKGEKYLYPDKPMNSFNGQTDFMRGNRMIDVVEAMQFEMFSGAIGESKWSVLPNIIAIMFKKEGEQLPIKSTEREKWIAERSKLFEELSVEEALNAAFFLLRRKNSSGKDLKQSSTHQAEVYQIREPQNFGKGTAGISQLSRSQSRDYSHSQT